MTIETQTATINSCPTILSRSPSAPSPPPTQPPSANLSAQLGYPAPHDTIRQRIEDLSISPDHALFAACLGADPVAWIEVSISRHLQSPPCALIGGLVVSSEARSRGIGKQLSLAAENWARDRGLALLRVRSQIAREQAHKFYLREGFRQTKVSAVFEKTLL